MTSELNPLDIRAIPELDRLAETVRITGKRQRLRRGNEDVAVLSPAVRRRRRLLGRVLTKDDPLLDLVGIGRSGGPGDVSANKHRYLAAAYRAKGRADMSS